MEDEPSLIMKIALNQIFSKTFSDDPMDQLTQALLAASSSDTQTRKQAEEQIREWQHHPNFHTTLLEIYASCPDTKIRFLAISCFKSGMDKYWRKTAKKYSSFNPVQFYPLKRVKSGRNCCVCFLNQTRN